MKKILALILAVVMTLALCACGQTAAPATAGSARLRRRACRRSTRR